MNAHGELTVQIARIITPDWEKRGYKVLYDHGSPGENVGKIVSTLKKDYVKEEELSQLDIAIVDPSNKVAVLVEIEETSDRPKTFLGDIFAVLLGEYIYFKKKELLIEDSKLFVVGISKTDHPKRNRYIQDLANKVKANMGTLNARIGKVEIKTYLNERELMEQLPPILRQAAHG